MIEQEFKKNYLTLIENAAKGENWLFRNFYIVKDGREIDALENGKISCATLVSSILYLQNNLLEFLKKPRWINFVHANVPSTTQDMLNCGWYEIKELRPGAVIIWEARKGIDDGLMHSHNGFCISNVEAVSNDSKGTGFPIRHPIDKPSSIDQTPRKVEKILWHSALN